MSSSPLESGFNTRDWPVKTGHPEVGHKPASGKSAFSSYASISGDIFISWGPDSHLMGTRSI